MITTQDPDRLLTPDEVRERLNLNNRTLLYWIQRKKISYIRISPRKIRIRESDIQRILDKGFVPAE